MVLTEQVRANQPFSIPRQKCIKKDVYGFVKARKRILTLKVTTPRSQTIQEILEILLLVKKLPTDPAVYNKPG